MTLATLRQRQGAPPQEVLSLFEKAMAAEPAALNPRLVVAQLYQGRQDVDAARRVLEEGVALAREPTQRAYFTRELDRLKSVHRIRAFLVELRCDPSGRLDFVVEAEGGRRLTLRAADPLAFTVFRNGESVRENLTCGKQRRKMLVNYQDLDAPQPGIDGRLSSLTIEDP